MPHPTTPPSPHPTALARLARPLLLGAGVLVALATLAIADMRQPGADAGQWLFMAGLIVAGFLPYAILVLAARTGPVWVAILAGLAMAALDLAARVRVHWFPQDAQDGLLLVALPVWLIPAALVLWCAMAVVQGIRLADARRSAEAARRARGDRDQRDAGGSAPPR